MVRRPLLSLLLFPCATALFAQTWTATDINGTTWSLQDLLAQGKTVLVDIATPTCPRQPMHEAGVYKKLWEEFGPDGSDELMIFWVDATGASTATLQNGPVDYVTGVPYPIISGQGQGPLVANAYNYPGQIHRYVMGPGTGAADDIGLSTFWPTAFQTLADHSPALIHGPTDANIIDMGAEPNCADGHAWVMLMNQGSAPLSNVTFTLEGNGIVLGTLAWTGTIMPMMRDYVMMPTGLLSGSGPFTVSVSVPGDAHAPGNEQAITVANSVEAPSRHLTLQVMTNNQPLQTGWQILNEMGNVEYQRVNGNYNDANDINVHQLELEPDHCYTLRVYDIAGNGMCCNAGNGFYALKNRYGTPNFFIQGGEFGYEVRHTFRTPASEPVGLEEQRTTLPLSLHPNPTTGLVSLELPSADASSLSVTVCDMTGRQVLAHSWMNWPGKGTVDLGAFPNGAYAVTVGTGERSSTQRVLLSK